MRSRLKILKSKKGDEETTGMGWLIGLIVFGVMALILLGYIIYQRTQGILGG